MTHIKRYLKEIERRLSPQTVAKYSEHLERFSDWRKKNGAEAFTKANARAFLVYLQEKNFAPSQVQHHRMILSAFHSWLVENEVIEFNPVAALRSFTYTSPKKGPECMFTEEEYRRLRTVATEEKRFRDNDWPGAIIIAWNTPMRMGDIANLSPADINIFGKKISVIPNKTKRINKRVEIPILPDLEAFLLTQSLQGLYVLPAMQREYAKSQATILGAQFSRICEAAGVEGKTFHGFRHTFTSRMLNKGIPATIVTTVTGHTLKVLERYSHSTFEQAQAAMEAMV